MTDFAYPLPQKESCVLQRFQHNFLDHSQEQHLTRLHQCDVNRNALTTYLNQYAYSLVGMSGGEPSSSHENESGLQKAKMVMDHHLQVASMCNEYLGNWLGLMQILESGGSGRYTTMLVDEDDGLYTWFGSASLDNDALSRSKKTAPCSVGDSSVRFETIMILTCTCLAHLNSAISMRTYTLLAQKTIENSGSSSEEAGIDTNLSRIQDITRDLLSVNKTALMCALEAQQQLLLFRYAPSRLLAEMRPRTLEALANYAMYSVQQLNLPQLINQYQAEMQQNANGSNSHATTSSAKRQLCASYMGLASAATITSIGANPYDCQMPQSHLALMGAMARAMYLIEAAHLRSSTLIDEAHNRSELGEMTRAETCLRGAYILSLFARQLYSWGAQYLEHAVTNCMIRDPHELIGVTKMKSQQSIDGAKRDVMPISQRWSETLRTKQVQWKTKFSTKTQKLIDRAKEGFSVTLPGVLDTLDANYAELHLHEVSKWLPQNAMRLSPSDMAVRLLRFRQDMGLHDHCAENLMVKQSNYASVKSEAITHLTSESSWHLPTPPCAFANHQSTLLNTVDVEPTNSDNEQPVEVLVDAPLVESVQNASVDQKEQLQTVTIEAEEIQSPLVNGYVDILNSLPSIPTRAPEQSSSSSVASSASMVLA
jgi:hypothetical protein